MRSLVPASLIPYAFFGANALCRSQPRQDNQKIIIHARIFNINTYRICIYIPTSAFGWMATFIASCTRMAPAVASAIFFGLLLLPHLCSSYQTSHNPWSRRFVRLRSSNDETRPSTPTETCSSIPSGADQILIIDQDASCLITFDEMFTSFIVLTLLNFCRPGKRQQVAFDPPL